MNTTEAHESRTAKGAPTMKTEEINRREFTRVPIQLDVEITSPSTTTQPTDCHIKDVSLNGLYLQCKNPLSTGSDCQVTITLGGGEDPVRIQVNGKVARTDTQGMGLEITEIVGIESFTHLQNLVRYNSATPEQVEQVEHEFSEHIGIKRKH
jgi:predicted nucleic acid-binding protein